MISRWTPARASRPDNLTFSTPRPARLTYPDRKYFPPVGCRREPPGHTSYFLCLYLSNAASLDLPLDAGEVLPARQSYFSVFTCPTQRVLISRWTPARCSRPDQTLFRLLAPKISNPVERDIPGRLAILAFSPPPARFDHPAHEYQSHVRSRKSLPAGTTSPFPPSSAKLTHQIGGHASPVGCRLSIPTQTLPFRLHLSNAVSLDSPIGRRRGAPGQTTLPFLVPRWRRLPVQPQRVLCPRWASM